MKKFWIIILMVLIPALVFAGNKRKQRQANQATAEWRYEIQNEAVGADNTALVKVWSYAKKVSIARKQAMKNAVHGLMFKGASGNNESAKRTKSLAPLITETKTIQEHEAFFNEFFKDGGEYARYATVSADAGAGSVEKIGKEYRVAVYVTVEYNQLRNLLEEKQIIEKIPEIVAGKLPTIMVVPSDLWCIRNGYYTEFDNQGTLEKIPDYARALQEDPNLLLVISKIGEQMAQRGYPLTDLESSLKRIKQEDAEMLLTQSKDTGNGVRETPLERLSRVAKADIWMQVTWSTNVMGPRQSTTFNLQGKDAYSDKQIAASSGTCPPAFSSTVELPVYLAEHVGANINPFLEQLTAHFKDITDHGREMRLTLRMWEDSDLDFEQEVDGEELSFVVEDLVSDLTMNHKYTLQTSSENVMEFIQMRIPLVDTKGRDLDARHWANQLKRTLRDKYAIESKLISKGLGHAILILGGK